MASRRRSRFDSLATSDRPRWLVVKDMHGSVIDSTMIAAGADLHELMAAMIRTRKADGWTVENDGSYGFVFCHKAGVRRMVALVQVDPTQPTAGAYPSQLSPA
jgi:hypothetical protein